LSREETIKEKNIKEDKYIHCRTKLARNEVNDPNEREKTKIKKGK
jgi:hypothetical protein